MRTPNDSAARVKSSDSASEPAGAICRLDVVLVALGLGLGLAVAPQPALAETASLDRASFRATHNTYSLDARPSILINEYNIWAIELDFGKDEPGDPFQVGHNGPCSRGSDAECGNSGMADELSAWLEDIKAAALRHHHPIILKLEAKMANSCGDFFCDWWYTGPENWDNPGSPWESQLRDLLISVLGEDNIVSKQQYSSEGPFAEGQPRASEGFKGVWPSADAIGPKFIVGMITNDDPPWERVDLNNELFNMVFQGEPPGLSGVRVSDASAFTTAILQEQIPVFDSEYLSPWSNVLVHPPVSSLVDPSHVGFHWGTPGNPFRTVGHAINSSKRASGLNSGSRLELATAHYSEMLRITSPARLQSSGGPVKIGGPNVAYTVTIVLRDIHEAGTDSPVFARISGSKGMTPEFRLANPITYMDRGVAETFWYMGPDVGTVQCVTLRVGGANDIAVDRILIDSAVSGRAAIAVPPADAWVGDDNVNPRTLCLH